MLGLVTMAANGLADDGNLSLDEIVALGTAAVVAYGVWRVPNKPAVQPAHPPGSTPLDPPPGERGPNVF